MKKVILVSGLLTLTVLIGCRANVEDAPDSETVEVVETPVVTTTPQIEVEPVEVPEVEEIIEPEVPVKTYIYYDIPLEHELQSHITDLCEEYGIETTVVLGMIESESGYITDIMGDGGNSYGLMQLQKRYFGARMEKLGVTDLLDPYQNVAVGIDFLAELIDYYKGNVEMALMAYNAGQGGAYENWFKHGIYTNYYSQKVLSVSKRLTEEVITRAEG